MEMASGPQKKATAAAAQPTKIQFGFFTLTGNQYAGKTIGEIRAQRGPMWQMPEDTVAMIGGQKVDDTRVLAEGDQLEFHRKAGEKG